MAAQKNYKRIEILVNGIYRGEVRYPHCPLFRLDLNDMTRFLYEKRPSLKYEKEVEIWIDGEQAFIYNKKRASLRNKKIAV